MSNTASSQFVVKPDPSPFLEKADGFVSAAGRSLMKRGLDILIALLSLFLFAPMIAFVLLLLQLETGEFGLVSQDRTGFRGRVFKLYRFRTMITPDAGQWPVMPRPSMVGGVLRKLSLDELPQIWNVLVGDMSLVGPRPHDVAHDLAYGRDVERYAERFRSRPGLTGLAQVSGLRGEISQPLILQDRVAADNHYIDNWSLGLDLAILAKTAGVLFRDPQK